MHDADNDLTARMTSKDKSTERYSMAISKYDTESFEDYRAT